MLPCRPLTVALVVALAGVSGCRKSAEPSPAYAEAQRRHLALLEAKGGEAYVDPEEDAILELLAQVPPDSSDAEAARALSQRIQAERARLQKEREEVDAALAFARQTPQVPEGEREEEGEPEPPTAAAPDAGVPHPTIGTTVAELTGRFSRCFQPGERMYVPDKGPRDTWELKDLAVCRELHPRYASTVLLVENGAIFAFGERGPSVRLLPDGGTESITP